MSSEHAEMIPVGPCAPGLTLKVKGHVKEVHGPFVHQHVKAQMVRRLAEEIHIPLVRTNFGEREPGPIIWIGPGLRELSRFLPGDHSCKSIITPHDHAHQRESSDQCSDPALCTVRGEVIYGCDCLYYMTPTDVGRMLDSHQAKAAYFAVNPPYVGGCGERFGGEQRWERIGDSREVRVMTDLTTREEWVHSDMVWLLETDGVRVGDRTLCWTPARNDGSRMLWRFSWSNSALSLASRPIADLRAHLRDAAGGGLVRGTYYGDRIAYTAAQVYAALGAPMVRDGIGGWVFIDDAMAVAKYLSRNPSQAGRWRELAAQKAGGLPGNADIDATVALAVEIARARAQSAARVAWAIFTPEFIRRVRAIVAWWMLLYAAVVSSAIGQAALGSMSVAAGVLYRGGSLRSACLQAVLAMVCSLMLRAYQAHVIGWLSGVVAAALRRCFPGANSKRIEYRQLAILPTCFPTVGVVQTDRGLMEVDECDCAEQCKKPTYSLAGISVMPEFLVAPCCCPKTLGSALKQRVLDVAIDSESARETVDAFIPRVKWLLGLSPGTVLDSGRMSFADWVAKPSFTESSRKALRLGRSQWSPNVQFLPSGSFVKCELSIKPGELFGARAIKPRAIRPVDPVLRARIGPSIAGLQLAVKEMFDGEPALFCCGRDGREIGEWFDEGNLRVRAHGGEPAWVLADYGNFDGTNVLTCGQTLAAAAMLALGYPLVDLHVDFAARSAMSTTYKQRAKWGAGLLLHEFDVSVFSGHDNTTLGNSLANLLVHLAVMEALSGVVDVHPAEYSRDGVVDFNAEEASFELEFHSVDVDRAAAAIADGCERTTQYRRPIYRHTAAVMGDDGLAIGDSTTMHQYKEDFDSLSKALGFIPESRVVTDLYEVEICSSLAWPSASGTVFGPKIGRVLAKTGFKRSYVHMSTYPALVRGDALGLRAGVAHIPILRRWVACLLRCTPARKHIEDNTIRHKVLAKECHVLSDDVWPFLSGRYGITQAEAYELEAQLDAVESLPAVLVHPLWEVIVRRDC